MPRPQNTIRYVPAQNGAQPKIIQVVEVQKDPLEPPRFRINQKVPRAPPSPPAPVMHSPPRKITAEEQKQWKIPPCVSSWKNPRGYTVPLDKRCAFNGRTGAQPEAVNPKFAQLSEALYISGKQHRIALEEQAKAKKLIAQKEKEKHEQKLRMLAQQARDERALVQRGFGHGRNDDSEEEGEDEKEDQDIDADELRDRKRIRDERHRERVRNANIKSSNPERRTRFDRNRERDISEQVALGVARPNDDNDVHDQRLYEQSQGLGSGFEHDDDYTVYDKAWKSQASFATNYRPSAALIQDAREREAEKESASSSKPVDDPLAPIQFEKEEVEDVFNVESFLRNAKYNARKMQESSGSSSKRHKH